MFILLIFMNGNLLSISFNKKCHRECFYFFLRLFFIDSEYFVFKGFQQTVLSFVVQLLSSLSFIVKRR